MAADVLINSLPCEVIEQILEDEILSINDVTSFALTCKQFHWTVGTSNKLWRTKFLQRWTFLHETFEDEGITGRIQSPVWREETKERLLCRQRLMNKLSRMSAKHYGKEELAPSDLREYDALFLPECGASPMAYHYLTDELVTLIEQPSIGSNLTHKHYAYKVVRYLRQTYLAKEWSRFLALPVEQQTTERGAILVAQWSQPEKRVSARRVSDMLDEIAHQTRLLIIERHPHIPINLVPKEELARWKNENIYDNQWSRTDSRTIVSTLCEIMFNKLGFHGNSDMYYSAVNSFIDQVLIRKSGIPITLAIVFESVARRLGLHCENASFPAHFLMRWKERYIPKVKEDENIEDYYIDVFNGGQFLTRNNCSGIAGATRCPIEKYNHHQAASAVKVIQRMASNLEIAGRQRTHLNGRAARLRSALELLHMVKPHDTNTILHLARFYMLHQMDLTELIKTLNELKNNMMEESIGQANHIMQMLQDYEKRTRVSTSLNVTTQKTRTPAVKYAVGMIMEDRMHNYLCVITGWDTECDLSSALFDFLDGMLDDVLKQPHYHVYFEDGSSRYVPQDHLYLTLSPDWVTHYEIGRCFSRFTGTYYVPNDEKAREYPEDEKVREELCGINNHNNITTTTIL